MTDFIKGRSANIKNDVLSGLTVALAMIPEVVAFAFVAQISPIVALFGAFTVGFITAVFGGRPGLISGAAGAVAVIFVNMIQEGHAKGLLFDVPVENMGYFYLLAAVVLMGVIQILVMMGFVNGLAIVIFIAQLGMFKANDKDLYGNNRRQTVSKEMVYSLSNNQVKDVVSNSVLFKVDGNSVIVPAALTAILVVTLVVVFGGEYLNSINIGDFIRDGGGKGLNGLGEISSRLNVFETWSVLPFNSDTLKFIFPYAFLAASVGLIETLMTMNLVDELTETRGQGNRECIAQGSGNILSGLFGGTGGCGMIGQTVINLKAGGRGRLSGVMMAVTLLVFVLFADKYIEQVPIAALVGVMFMMVIETFAWSSFRILRKIPKADAVVLILVSAVTVFFDLAIAVFVGVIISAIVFAWESAKRIRARKRIMDNGTKVYEIWGPLFFGSITAFNDKFDVKNDPENVVIDFVESRISDHSGLEAVLNLVAKYEAEGKQIKLKHLNEESKQLLYKSNPKFKEVIIEAIDDPRYHLAENPEKFTKPLSEYKL